MCASTNGNKVVTRQAWLKTRQVYIALGDWDELDSSSVILTHRWRPRASKSAALCTIADVKVKVQRAECSSANAFAAAAASQSPGLLNN